MGSLNGEKVLITGGAGFVGSNLVRRILDDGADVNLIMRSTSNKWRIKDILSEINEHSVDLMDYDNLVSIVSEIKPSIIFHLATYGGSPFQKDTQNIIRSNFVGTMNLVNACKKVGFESFINTSSSSEYGNKKFPMSELDLLEPINDYGVSKAASTLYCHSIAKNEDLPIITLRLFSPYGSYEDSRRLIPHVILSILRNKSPNLTSPEFVRDFIFIEDVLDAFINVAQRSDLKDEVFNIGSGIQNTVGNVVNNILEIMGHKIEPKWGSTPEWSNEPVIWQADISRAKDILKWSPKHDLKGGMLKTINWFEKHIELYNGD